MFEAQGPRFVTAAEITRNFGMWQDRAAQGPLVVTHHGRPRCVLISAENYRAMTEADLGDGDAREGDRDAIGYALVAERIKAGLVELDRDLVVARVNAVAALMLERPAEQLVGHALAEIVPTLATGLAGARLRRAAREAEESTFDLPMPGGGGLAVQAFPWPGGAALLLRHAGCDEAAERATASAEALHVALAAHGGVGVVRLTVRGTIAEADASFATLVGFERQRLVGVRAVDLMALSARSGLAETIERVLSGGGAGAIDSRLLVNAGDELPVRVAIGPVSEGLAIGGATMVVTTA